MIRLLLPSLLILASLYATGQDSTRTVMTYEQYIALVLDHHPLMQQAELLTQQADAYVMKGKGEFDPKIAADWNKKNYKDTEYYNLLSSSLSVPTWIGADLKLGYERSSGDFQDPSDNLPLDGLWSIGVDIPIGEGLFYDERRQARQQAELYAESTEIERDLLLNDLLYDASLAYLEWARAMMEREIALTGIRLAEQRLTGVRASFLTGDGPAVDTLEADVNLLARRLSLQIAEQEIVKARAELSMYLWLEGVVPLELEPGVDAETDVLLDLPMIQASDIHPYLRAYDNKIALTELDQRMAKERLKPDLNISYHPLAEISDRPSSRDFTLSDYKLGVNFTTPLFLRKERAELRLVQLKIAGLQLERGLEAQNLNAQQSAALASTVIMEQQLQTLERTISQYDALLRAEYRKLAIGESSIFVVNSREVKYLDFLAKSQETRIKLNKTLLSRAYYDATLYELLSQ